MGAVLVTAGLCSWFGAGDRSSTSTQTVQTSPSMTGNAPTTRRTTSTRMTTPPAVVTSGESTSSPASSRSEALSLGLTTLGAVFLLLALFKNIEAISFGGASVKFRVARDLTKNLEKVAAQANAEGRDPGVAMLNFSELYTDKLREDGKVTERDKEVLAYKAVMTDDTLSNDTPSDAPATVGPVGPVGDRHVAPTQARPDDDAPSPRIVTGPVLLPASAFDDEAIASIEGAEEAEDITISAANRITGEVTAALRLKAPKRGRVTEVVTIALSNAIHPTAVRVDAIELLRFASTLGGSRDSPAGVVIAGASLPLTQKRELMNLGFQLDTGEMTTAVGDDVQRERWIFLPR